MGGRRLGHLRPEGLRAARERGIEVDAHLDDAVLQDPAERGGHNVARKRAPVLRPAADLHLHLLILVGSQRAEQQRVGLRQADGDDLVGRARRLVVGVVGIQGGTIRQHRTYLDEETGIENVRGFLREWQKVIKKRLTASERELAKISAVKREENLQELREKNNTRVLQGLMEDFMEAV